MKKFFYWLAVPILAVAAITLASTSMAQETAVAVEGVTIPWGKYVSDLATTVAALTVPAVAWLFRALPGQWANMLIAARADQLLERSISYGINSVADASHDKKLTVPIANDVLREAVQYAVDNAPRLVKTFGGVDVLRKKIIARLEVEESASVSSVMHPSSASVAIMPQFIAAKA